MFTRQKSVVATSRSQVRSRRIAEAAEINKEKKLNLKGIDEIQTVKRIARAKRRAPENMPSPQIKNRKRKVDVTTPNKSKKLRSSKDIQDKQVKAYCWICYKICQDRTCVCKRVYHNECLEKSSLEFIYNECPECQLKSAKGPDLTRPFTKELKVYLESAIQLITYKHKKKKLSWSEITDVIGGINMKTLLKKVHNNVYKTTLEFFSDVKWLYHISCVLYGEHSKKTKDMSIVIKDFKEELYDMEACPDCYYHLNCIKGNDSDEEKHFVRLCNPPHDIVWARVPGHPYWPAKLLKVENGKTRVRFFGKHEKADVATHTIFHMSESHPTHEHRNIRATETRTSLEYTYAKKELLDYITIYERSIGNFQFFGFRLFYVPANDCSRTCNETQKLTNKVSHKMKTDENNMISTNSSAFCRLLPLTSMTSISSEPYESAISSSNRDVSVNMTFCVDTPSSGNNCSDIRNYPSTNSVVPSSIALPYLQNVESTLDQSTPSENSSFPSTSSNPASACMSPCSSTNLRYFQIKKENCNLDEPYRISSVDSLRSTSENLMLQNALLNTANFSSSEGSPFYSRSCLGNIFQGCSDEDNLQCSIVKEEKLDCASSTSEMDGTESDFISTENVPSLITINETESQNNAISTESVPSPNPSRISLTQNQANVNSTENVNGHIPAIGIHQTENISNANSPENLSDLPSSEIDRTENVSNMKIQQPLQKGTVSLPSSTEISVIDLTGDDDHDNSDIRLSNVFAENPQMRQLLVQTQKVVGNFLTRVCEEVCHRQNPAPTQLCQTLTRKLNETEKKFQEETDMLRDEIKRLQKRIDAKLATREDFH